MPFCSNYPVMAPLWPSLALADPSFSQGLRLPSPSFPVLCFSVPRLCLLASSLLSPSLLSPPLSTHSPPFILCAPLPIDPTLQSKVALSNHTPRVKAPFHHASRFDRRRRRPSCSTHSRIEEGQGHSDMGNSQGLG